MSDAHEFGIGDIVRAIHSPAYGTGILVDTDDNRTASLRVLFDDDDYADWFHPLELAEAVAVPAAPKRPSLRP